MKSIQTNAIITSLRSRADRSLGFSGETPEYTDEEFATFRSLQGLNVKLTIEPLDEKATETLVIDREAGGKSPSERMRAVIYRMWESKKETWPDQEAYYRHVMEKLLEQLKEKI